MSDTTQSGDPAEVLRQVVEDGFNEEAEEVVLDGFADEVKVLQSPADRTMTAEQVWGGLKAEFEAFPDYTHQIQGVWQDGEMAFARYTATGTFENEIRVGEAVLEPTGEEGHTAGMMAARVQDGEIKAFGGFWDKLSLFQQLDIVPPLDELAD
jgi:predicted ester cyclase